MILYNEIKDGFNLLAVQNFVEIRCGYIGIPFSKFSLEKILSKKDELEDISVYGGITYDHEWDMEGNCDVPDIKEVNDHDSYFWIGWDYCHNHEDREHPENHSVEEMKNDLNNVLKQVMNILSE